MVYLYPVLAVIPLVTPIQWNVPVCT